MLKLLVLGGSLGARALNDIVPRALALLEPTQRPQVLHQSGSRQIDALRANYAAAAVQADLTPFIEDTARAFAEADLVICRAGATTLAEIAAAGRPAILVPFPWAADDHQRLNAEAVVAVGGAMMIRDADLTGHALASHVAALAGDRERRRRECHARR